MTRPGWLASWHWRIFLSSLSLSSLGLSELKTAEPIDGGP
jgi:hypothetical protein